MLNIKEVAKENIKSDLSIGKLIKDARASNDNKTNTKPKEAVTSGTSEDVFKERYKNVAFSIYFLLFAMFISVVTALIYSSVSIYFVCGITFSMFFMFCFKYSFIAWRARIVYQNWDTRHEGHNFTTRDFIDSIKLNPLELFPTKLRR